MKKRRWARFIAWSKRKFWTNCPRCGDRFGGHEPYAMGVTFTENGRTTPYRFVCRKCAPLADVIPNGLAN